MVKETPIEGVEENQTIFEKISEIIGSAAKDIVNNFAVGIPKGEWGIGNPFTGTEIEMSVVEQVNPDSVLLTPESISLEAFGLKGIADISGGINIKQEILDGKLGYLSVEGGIGKFEQLYITPITGNDQVQYQSGTGQVTDGIDASIVQKYIMVMTPVEMNKPIAIELSIKQKPLQKVAAKVAAVGVAYVAYSVGVAGATLLAKAVLTVEESVTLETVKDVINTLLQNKLFGS